MGDQNEINSAINLYVANAKNNRTAPKTVFYFLLKKSRRTISSTTQQRANGHNNKRNGRKVKRKRKKTIHILATATKADLHAWRSHLNNMTSYFRNFFRQVLYYMKFWRHLKLVHWTKLFWIDVLLLIQK